MGLLTCEDPCFHSVDYVVVTVSSAYRSQTLLYCHGVFCVAGLPKAAVITHLQSLKAAAGFWAYGGTGCDVIYTPLPLYHSAASLVGIGGTIELGNSLNQTF